MGKLAMVTKAASFTDILWEVVSLLELFSNLKSKLYMFGTASR